MHHHRLKLTTPALLAALLLAPYEAAQAGSDSTSATSPKTLQGSATSAPLDVGRDDPRRRPILDGLRRTLEPELGQPLRFMVQALRERGGFAFAQVQPLDSSDRPLDWSRTPHAEAMREGWMDGDTTYALLRLEGGQWRVLAHAIGPTDVAWADWPERFGVAHEVLGLPAH